MQNSGDVDFGVPCSIKDNMGPDQIFEVTLPQSAHFSVPLLWLLVLQAIADQPAQLPLPVPHPEDTKI
jgi:hypothetical protein